MLTRTQAPQVLSLGAAVSNLFSTTEKEATPSVVHAALIDFYDAVEQAGTDAGGFYSSVRAEAILPIAQSIAQKIVAHMGGSLIEMGANKKDRDRFSQLSRAFCDVAYQLDVDDADEDRPAYHNRAHNLLVMAARLVRGRTVMAGLPVRAGAVLTELRDLVAALGHDLGHDGTNNRARGTYEAFRLEQKSYARVAQALDAAGVSAKDKAYIRFSILATDPDVPGDIVTYAHHAHFGTGVGALTRGALLEKIDAMAEKDRPLLRDLMAALEKDADLTISAAALKGADMVPSFGLGPAMWAAQSRLFHTEVVRTAPDRPIVDERGLPKPLGQLFVMLNFVGAELCARPRAQQGPQNFLLARFMDPEMNRLFGGSLRALQEQCAGEAGPTQAGIVTAYGQKFGLDLH